MLYRVMVVVVAAMCLLPLIKKNRDAGRINAQASQVAHDANVVTSNILAMPAKWTEPVEIPDGTPWFRIFPENGTFHYFLRVHRRFTNTWETLGPFTRADANTNIGDNINVVEFMSGETIPITIVCIVQKPSRGN
jgi:hypothetical protein